MDEKEYLSQDNFQNFDESKEQEDELIRQDEVINDLIYHRMKNNMNLIILKSILKKKK